jgi:hypothetical protein
MPLCIPALASAVKECEHAWQAVGIMGGHLPASAALDASWIAHTRCAGPLVRLSCPHVLNCLPFLLHVSRSYRPTVPSCGATLAAAAVGRCGRRRCAAT